MLSVSEIKKVKNILEQKVAFYNQKDFIAKDPISIPHLYSQKQDIEISGLFAATLAWGNRTAIINSCQRLLQLMDNAPYDFVLNFKEDDLKPMLRFVHRTFNAIDLFSFLHFLQYHYSQHKSLENAFVPHKFLSVENALIHFHNYFISAPHFTERTKKHISTPLRKSACKRLNMYLRWMVRNDGIVDFGIWKKIAPKDLVCPLDVHVGRVARKLGILERTTNDWQAALELTDNLRKMCTEDPVRYDFALFGLGVEERYR